MVQHSLKLGVAGCLLALGMTGCVSGQQHAADANGTEGQGSGPTHVGSGTESGTQQGGSGSATNAQTSSENKKQ
jgi:hypothetical protein